MATNSPFTDRFNEGKFRFAVRGAMQMGMPENDDDKLKWWWRRSRTYTAPDPAGNPYDWTSTPSSDQPGNPDIADPDPTKDQHLTVDYALEFSSRPAGSIQTILGEIDNSRAVVTLFDEDWEKVKTADYCTIDNSTYNIQFAGPAQGLFGVTMHTVYLEAVDEA